LKKSYSLCEFTAPKRLLVLFHKPEKDMKTITFRSRDASSEPDKTEFEWKKSKKKKKTKPWQK